MSRLRNLTQMLVFLVVGSALSFAQPPEAKNASPAMTINQTTSNALSITPNNLPGLATAAGAISILAQNNWYLYEKEYNNPSTGSLVSPIAEIYRDWQHFWSRGRTFIVQTEYPGQRYGMSRNNWFRTEDAKWAPLLFATEPIVTFKDRALVILTSMQPMRTQIYVLDKYLKPTLVFDGLSSSTQTKYTVSLKDPDDELMLFRIFEIIYQSPGKYTLIQYADPMGVTPFIQETEITAIGDRISLHTIKKIKQKEPSPYRRQKKR